MELLWLWILLAVIVVLAVVAIIVIVSARKTVARQQARLEAAWADIAQHIDTRGELLGTLRDRVATVADHERTKLAAVDDARAELDEATRETDAARASEAEDRVQGSLRELLRVAEGYPDLQRDKAFLRVQGDLAREGGEIQTSRRQFNGTVREYNTKVRTFPGSLVAKQLGAAPRSYFEVTDRAAISAPPKVQF